MVLKQLKEHLSENSLFEEVQSAYKEHHNTETALLKVQNDLLLAADTGNTSILTLLDLSAAFDTIDHSILLDRLSITFGLSGTIMDWFGSYLRDRTQCVVVKGKPSDLFNLECGVPQGSVLGPILYTLYTSPLGSIIKKHNILYHMYADDTQLYQSVCPSELPSLLEKFETCIKEVKHWMKTNKLQLNEEKTECLIFNFSGQLHSPDHIKIGNETIPFTKKAKNLGVYFDDQLSMDSHISNLCRQMYLELRRIGAMVNFLDESSRQILISSFILSRLDYCKSLLFNLPDNSLNKLQRCQNNAARVILRKRKREHVTHVFKHPHWLPIKGRIHYKIALLLVCYK